MPRKKSVRLSAQDFLDSLEDVERFVANARFKGGTDKFSSWVHEYAIVRTYSAFEKLMLDALVGAINNDTSAISSTLGIDFPKHLTDEVCEYLVTGGRYFDFRGRDGLIQQIVRFVPDTHYLVRIVRAPNYRVALDRLSALRNFAAHHSEGAKEAALKATGQKRMSSAGSWLKRQDRLAALVEDMRTLAREVKKAAPI